MRVFAEFRHIFQFCGESDLQVMAGHGLVQRKCGNLVFWPRFRPVKIDKIGPGTRSVCGGRAIISGGRVGRHMERNGLNSERNPWQFLEDKWQLRLDPFTEFEVSCHQVLRVSEMKLGRRPQMFEEIGERSLKTNVLLDSFHFGADPLDLGQSDFVNLAWRKSGRRVLACEECIELLAARQLRGPRSLQARREVFSLKKAEELPIRRDDLFANRRLCLPLQSLAVSDLELRRK